MKSISLGLIAEILAPITRSSSIPSPALPIRELLTDSRSLLRPEGTLFFALATPGGDGHRYIANLYRRGVRAFIVSQMPDDAPADAAFIVVDDTLDALRALASARRDAFEGRPVIAITGSRGKTTVKEMLFRVLSPDRVIARSPRSFNSRIGVPLSLWGVTPEADIAILEAGISEAGEMQSLASLIRPTIGILTTIDDEHASGFPSRRAKIEEKISLFNSCSTIIYGKDDRDVAEAISSRFEPSQLISWSRTNPDATLFIADETYNPVLRSTTLTYRWRGEEHIVTMPITERADIDDAISALALMHILAIDPHEIARRMASLAPVGTRLNVMEGTGDSILILDSFTADISSLPSALDFLNRRRTSGRPVSVILSDISHDAADPRDIYAEAADLLSRAGIDSVACIGPEISAAASEFADRRLQASFFPSTDAFLASVAPESYSGRLILVKGSAPFGFEHIADHLEARLHETVLEVNLDAVADNYNWFRAHLRPSTGIICMVKASGYGAGSYEIAKTLQSRGAAYVAVAVVDEGVALRDAGVTMPVMVMNPRVANYRTMFAHRLEPEVYSFDLLEDILEAARRCDVRNFPIHIKIDTGMHRLGFRLEEIDRLAEILNAPANRGLLVPSSVFSHLAVADCPAEDDYTRSQFAYFEEASKRLISHFPGIYIRRHILNSTGIVRFPEYQYDMVRLGIGLYGVATMDDGSQAGLRPVSALLTSVIAVREWPAGTTIGYGRYGRLDRPSRIATIPVGYADGIDRHLGRGAMRVWIRGHRCPTIGNICMDACMIDVTDIPDCRPGDRVEIFGPHVPAAELAATLDTIPYEILTSVSERVKRVYYRE